MCNRHSKIHCLNSDWTGDLSLLRYKPDFVTSLFVINELYCMTFSISTCILSWDLHISLRWILLLANLWLVLFTFTCYTYAKSIILMLNIWWIKILSLQLNITSGEVGDLFTLILIKITLLSLGHIVEVLDTLVKFCMLAVFCMSLWICIEEFLFKVLCEFVWRNSCSM